MFSVIECMYESVQKVNRMKNESFFYSWFALFKTVQGF